MLPENAPFSPAQRAWLNGFFAGLLGARTNAAAGVTTPAVPSAAPAGEVRDRHELDDRDAKFGEIIEALLDAGEGSLGREGADVEFVDEKPNQQL